MRIGVVAVVLAWLIVLSVWDLARRRLPNVLTLPGGAAVLIGAAVAGRGGPALAGAVGLTAVYLLVHLLAPAAMGGGDVKLAIGLGGLTGCFGVGVWFLAALAAPLLTAVVGVLGRVRFVPHGPSMCVASALAVGLVLVR